MCGVIGLIYERGRQDLGLIAAELLKALEYRGYDSTGAAIQSADSEEVDLRKDVGAPSAMVEELGIVKLGGQILCGQVRWATFGAVDAQNAQPHVVRCKTHLYGAHNGNVTNCDELKRWLTEAGHQVLSDNDGEMVVHTVEHFFALELNRSEDRTGAMRRAIVEAGKKLKGSYAAVVVDPVTRTVWAIKRGSSLYFGIGEDETGGRFGIASSDLSAVLKLTRVLIPMSQGEFVEFEGSGRHRVLGLNDGAEKVVKPVRSRLRAKDTALSPPFSTFMEQEIDAQEETSRDVIRIFSGGSPSVQQLGPTIDSLTHDEQSAIRDALETLQDQYEDDAIRSAFDGLMATPAFTTLLGRTPARYREESETLTPEDLADQLFSAEQGFFADLLQMARANEERLAVRVLDAFLERIEVAEVTTGIAGFCQRCIDTMEAGGRIYLVCCGTSFHAAKAASLFFDDLASTEVIALLPGEFRGQYANSIKEGDLFIAVSQSGETKDLIDVLNGVIETGLDIERVALVNNVNSTLAQEKCDLVIPLRCGPEIAVPATKSFINQLTVFYCLAVRLAERRLTTGHVLAGQAKGGELSRRNRDLSRIPALIRETIRSTDSPLNEAAELLFLVPSMHLLATRLLAVAREGALKLREVVLNHTEGFEGSEFKHGPNTILGFNTIFGPRQVERLLFELGRAVEAVGSGAQDPAVFGRVAKAVVTSPFDPESFDDLSEGERALALSAFDRQDALGTLKTDYPLVYITGPDPRDVALTVSQINTHKIRGSTTVVIAEEDPDLMGAAQKAPADNDSYRSVYVKLPATNDTLMTVFSATVALQRLALKMSLKKLAYLNRLGFRNHGVHPDVPKNVSKSITVD